MTQDRISVRQWQELYRAGAFEKDNEQTRELAGWGGVDDPLNNWQMKKLSRLVLAVTHPFILDNYRVFFSVGQPNVGHKYGFRHQILYRYHVIFELHIPPPPISNYTIF